MRFCLFLSVVAAAGTPGSLLAQNGSVDTNAIAVLQTGSGQPLSTFSQTLAATTDPSAVLRFSFGFSTDEAAAPNTFLDSVSLTLQGGPNQSQSAIFFTVDANGVTWAPPTPGNIVLDTSGWTLTPLTFPDLSPNRATKFAWEVSAPLPSAFNGHGLNFYFDLFDNQNSAHSTAWITPVTVPEPGALALSLFSLFGFVLFKRSRF